MEWVIAMIVLGKTFMLSGTYQEIGKCEAMRLTIEKQFFVSDAKFVCIQTKPDK
jgi:hypothetical protein